MIHHSCKSAHAEEHDQKAADLEDQHIKSSTQEMKMNLLCIVYVYERVEDLQLGVKSYQKKINLKKPDTYRSNLRRMTPYTAYPDIQGIIYEDEINRNRLMRTDELHKFSDGSLNHVHIALNGIA
ncbi:hypothetical protein Tco_0057964 [Tanacetum coccineum]